MPIALVGSSFAANNSKTAGTTLTIAGGSVSTGDVVVVAVGYDNTGTSTPTVTISNSGTAAVTWTTQVTADSSTATSGGGVLTAIATGVVTSGGTLGTVTATFSASITAKAGTLAVFSGVDTTTPVRSGTSGTGQASSTTTSATTGATNPVNGDLVIGAHTVEAPSANSNDSDTTNGSWNTFTTAATSGGGSASNVGIRASYKIVTADGAQEYGANWGSTVDWSAAIIALQPASSGAAASDAPSNATRRQLPLLVR